MPTSNSNCSKAPNAAEDYKAIGVSAMPPQSFPQLSLPDWLLVPITVYFAFFAISATSILHLSIAA